MKTTIMNKIQKVPYKVFLFVI